MEKVVSLADVQAHPMVKTFIEFGNQHLGVMGYTEHSFRHATLVANIASNILARLGHPERDSELAAIAGYLHDIGNVVSRYNHGQTGAWLAKEVLRELGMGWEEIALIMSAIGNHEEEYGQPVNKIAAALILADKSDVHRSRVRCKDVSLFDIHDRVNSAAEHSFLRVDEEAGTITLELTIDTNISGVMEYFEIFLTRMIMCRRAADFLEVRFSLVVNDSKLL